MLSLKSWWIRKPFRNKNKTWQRKGRLVWLQKWVPRLLKHSVLALWREPLALHGQAIFLKSCTVQRRKCEGSRNKALLSLKLLTSFIPLSPYHYAHCPDTVQRVDISLSRVRIVTTEKGNPRDLISITFVMTSCSSDESKHLSNYSGKEFSKNSFQSPLAWGQLANYVYKPLQVSGSFFKSSRRLCFCRIIEQKFCVCQVSADLSIRNGNSFGEIKGKLFGEIIHWDDRWVGSGGF